MGSLHTAVLELDHLVGELPHGTVVRGDHERDARIDQRADTVHHELSRLRVELRRRLVRDDDGGAGDDGLRERGPLLLPTRQLVGEMVDAMADAQPVEDVVVLRSGGASGRQAQMLPDREVRQEVVRGSLEHVADDVAPEPPEAACRRPRHVPWTHPDVTGRRAIDPGEHTEERGLPAPRRSDHGGERAGRETERHAAERVHRAGGSPVRLHEVDAAGRDGLTRQRGAPPRGRSPRPSGARATLRPRTRWPDPRASRGPRRSAARTRVAAGSSAAGREAAR